MLFPTDANTGAVALDALALAHRSSGADAQQLCGPDAEGSDSDGDGDGDGDCTSLGDLLEPSREPCAGEIPFVDLVFWLGDAATGRVDACACPACWREWQRARLVRSRRQRLAPYGRLSSRVPVIRLPRIEGVN